MYLFIKIFITYLKALKIFYCIHVQRRAFASKSKAKQRIRLSILAHEEVLTEVVKKEMY